MPTVPRTTETLSSSIYHALDASEPQLALLETGLSSSFPGPRLKQQLTDSAGSPFPLCVNGSSSSAFSASRCRAACLHIKNAS